MERKKEREKIKIKIIKIKKIKKKTDENTKYIKKRSSYSNNILRKLYIMKVNFSHLNANRKDFIYIYILY